MSSPNNSQAGVSKVEPVDNWSRLVKSTVEQEKRLKEDASKAMKSLTSLYTTLNRTKGMDAKIVQNLEKSILALQGWIVVMTSSWSNLRFGNNPFKLTTSEGWSEMVRQITSCQAKFRKFANEIQGALGELEGTIDESLRSLLEDLPKRWEAARDRWVNMWRLTSYGLKDLLEKMNHLKTEEELERFLKDRLASIRLSVIFEEDGYNISDIEYTGSLDPGSGSDSNLSSIGRSAGPCTGSLRGDVQPWLFTTSSGIAQLSDTAPDHLSALWRYLSLAAKRSAASSAVSSAANPTALSALVHSSNVEGSKNAI